MEPSFSTLYKGVMKLITVIVAGMGTNALMLVTGAKSARRRIRSKAGPSCREMEEVGEKAAGDASEAPIFNVLDADDPVIPATVARDCRDGGISILNSVERVGPNSHAILFHLGGRVGKEVRGHVDERETAESRAG
jgi:hypothetical protein